MHAFSRSGWIQDTLGEVLSHSVTSCADMTAKVTIIAQTRIGFSGLRRIPMLIGYLLNGPLYIPVVSLALLTEGRTARDIPKQRGANKKKGLRRIPKGEKAEDAFHVQLEDAAARATVALTCKRTLCHPWTSRHVRSDWCSSLVYGVEICWRQSLELHYQQEELETGMNDERMMQMLKQAGPWPRLSSSMMMSSSLGGCILSLWILGISNGLLGAMCLSCSCERPCGQRWQVLVPGTQRLYDSAESGRQQHQVRFVCGYALDASTCPCYCVPGQR